MRWMVNKGHSGWSNILSRMYFYSRFLIRFIWRNPFNSIYVLYFFKCSTSHMKLKVIFLNFHTFYFIQVAPICIKITYSEVFHLSSLYFILSGCFSRRSWVQNILVLKAVKTIPTYFSSILVSVLCVFYSFLSK